MRRVTDCAGAPPALRQDGGRAASAGAEALRARIAALLADPAVAERVRLRLARARAPVPADAAGTPPCLRAILPARERRSPILVRAGRCVADCGGIDCLCGRYPPKLESREIARGRLERLAV